MKNARRGQRAQKRFGRGLGITAFAGLLAAFVFVGSASATTVITMAPMGPSQFRLTPSTTTPRAGDPVNLTIEALNAQGNTASNYSGPHALKFAGANDAPAGNHPTVSDNTGASVSFGTTTAITFDHGVASVSGVSNGVMRLYKAETASVTVSEGSIHSPAVGITVSPASPATLVFINRPTETQVSSIINATAGGVQVQASDAYGNLASNTSVKVAIDSTAIPPGGTSTLGGTTTVDTDANGVATFDDLTIGTVGVGYILVANAPPNSPTATQKSNAFIVAQTVSTCSNTCSPSTVTPSTTLTVNASGTGSSTLGIALIGGVMQPAGFCGAFQPATGSPASFVNVNSSTVSNSLMLTISWLLPAAIVNAQSDNGAAHYNLCLGAVNLTDPDNQHSTTGYPIKAPTFCPTAGSTISTACPRHDATFGVTFFWGVLPDCPATKKITLPCVISRNKNAAGDLIFKYAVPYPWDPNGVLG